MFKIQFSSPGWVRVLAGIGLLSALLAGRPVSAATVRWQGPVDGLWTDPTKWDAERVPGRSDDVIIDVAGSSNYTVTLNTTSAINSLTLGAATGTSRQILNVGGVTFGGSLSIIAASTIRAKGQLNLQGTLTGTGNLTVAGIANWQSGTMTGTGTCTVASGGILDMSPPSGVVTLSLARPLINSGTVRWVTTATSGGVAVQTSTPITNQTSGIFEFQGAGSFTGIATNIAPVFSNVGTLRKKGTGTLDFSGLLFNLSGPLDVQGGNVRVLGGGSVPASTDGDTVIVNVATGTQWILASNFNFNGKADIIGDGLFKLSSGSVSVAQDVSVDRMQLAGATLTGGAKLKVKKSLNWSSGSLKGAGILECSSSAISTISGSTTKTLTRRVDNFGSMTWGGSGDISVTASTVWNNAPLSTLTVTDDARFVAARTASVQFQNAGTLLKNVGDDGSTTFENVTVVNTGVVESRSGDLNLGDKYFQNSGRTTLNGGSLSARNAQLINSTIEIRGGSLTGKGVINGNVLNKAKCVPGFSPGLMEVNGNYVQTADGSLDAEIAGLAPGTEYDQLSVSGDVTLAGTLNTALLNGFAPPPNSSFEVITFGGVLAGKFDAIGNPAAGPGQYFTAVNGLGFVAAATSAEAVVPTGTISRPLEGKAYPAAANLPLTAIYGTAADTTSGVASATIVVARFASLAAVTPTDFLVWTNGTFTTPQGPTHDKIATGTTSWTATPPVLPGGYYGVRVTIKDFAGNSGFVPSSSTWRRFSVPTVFNISGKVTDQNGLGVAGVVITRSGLAPNSVATSGADGTYTFTSCQVGVNTLTASNGAAQTFVFNPASQNVTVGAANVSNVLFLALTTPAITGRAVNSLGVGVSSVTVTRTGGAAVVSNASGYYGFSGVTPNSGNTTLTPTRSNSTFTPASLVVNVGANSEYGGNNFTVLFSVKGTITQNGLAKSGVRVDLKLNGAVISTKTTAASGSFTFTGVAASATEYVVEPSLTGFTFSPTSTNVTVSTATQSNILFTATAVGPIQVLKTAALTANSSTSTVTLRLGTALASGQGAYSLTINGVGVSAAATTIDLSTGEITWELPSERLQPGDAVAVSWTGFADADGNPLSGSAGPVVAE